MMAAADPWNAFTPDGRYVLRERHVGPLDDLTFAVKDVFDVRGHVTAAGNPTRGVETDVASSHATVVAGLLDAGAELHGKTVNDEFAYGIMGTNPHYGDPRNAAAPGHYSGGSSCGSAAAVAAGLCDFALGSDTGGSIRIPASYCGIYGFRPSHGRVPTAGMVPLAPRFDTAGWLARDASTLSRVGRVLLGPPDGEAGTPQRLLVARDALELLETGARAPFRAIIDRLRRLFGQVGEISLAGPAADLATLFAAYRTVQAHQAWATHGDWVERHPGALGTDAQQRFDSAAQVSRADAKAAAAELERYASWATGTLDVETVICLPAAPGAAPRTDTEPGSLLGWRVRTMQLSCAAPAAGIPAVTAPLVHVDGLPLGISFLGARGGDHRLLALATRTADVTARTDVTVAPGGAS